MKYKLQISISNAQNLLDLIEYYNGMIKEFRGYINWKADYEEILDMGKDFFNFYIPDLRFVASEICYERWRDESRLSINRNSGELEYHIEMHTKIESQEDIADAETALKRTKQCISIYQRFIDDVMKLDIEGNAGVTDSVKVKDDALDDEMAMWKQRSNDEFGQVIQQIENYFKEYVGETQSEYEGIKETPITWVVASYGLDGNKRSVANKIYNAVVDYDLYGNGDDEFDALVNKMTQLAM